MMGMGYRRRDLNSLWLVSIRKYDAFFLAKLVGYKFDPTFDVYHFYEGPMKDQTLAVPNYRTKMVEPLKNLSEFLE